MIILKYWNEQLQIGLTDWKNVYKFLQQQILQAEIHQNKFIPQGKYENIINKSKKANFILISKHLSTLLPQGGLL